MLADYSEALSWRLDTFRPSDRKILAAALESDELNEKACGAILQFLKQWADAEWHDDSIRRLGVWLSRYANDDIKRHLATQVVDEDHNVYKIFLSAINGTPFAGSSNN